MKTKLVAITMFFILLSVITAYAVAIEWTTTLLYFNINANRDVQVLTLGGTWVSATSGGAPTSGNIEFNTSQADSPWINASIAFSANDQDDTTPIVQIRNIGTISAQVNITMNQTLPAGACTIRLRYSNDTITYPPTVDVTTSNITLINSIDYGDTPLDLWLFANFTGCSTGDTTQRNFTIYADYAS